MMIYSPIFSGYKQSFLDEDLILSKCYICCISFLFSYLLYNRREKLNENTLQEFIKTNPDNQQISYLK